jgi:hypothetical protein
MAPATEHGGRDGCLGDAALAIAARANPLSTPRRLSVTLGKMIERMSAANPCAIESKTVNAWILSGAMSLTVTGGL